MNKSIFILLMLASCTSPSNTALKLVPKLVVKQDTIDLGIVHLGEEIQQSIPIMNQGKSDLIIYETKGSCSCTSAKMSNKVIKPGKLAALRFTFHAPDHLGETINTICLRTNSKAEFYLIKIKAKILE